MKPEIILLCNTCPYRGEIFLQKELLRIPEDQPVTLFPLLASPGEAKSFRSGGHMEVCGAGSRPNVSDCLAAVLHSLPALFRQKELSAVFSHRQPLRNLLKALKFAFLGESRARAVRRWLKRNRPETGFVFYSYWLYETAYAAARLQKLFPGSRFFSRCHSFDLYEYRHPNGYLPYRSFLMASADGIFPVSGDAMACLSRQFRGKWDHKLRLMRLGTEDHGRNPEQAPGELTLVSCSNAVAVKRIDRIIDALMHFPMPVRWVHFGDGPLLEQLRLQAGYLPEHICWEMPGAVPNDRLMEFYQSTHVDAFLNVSVCEGIPVSIMEALSFGIPVIATDVGGTRELLTDGQNGRLLPAGFESEALVQAILYAAASPQLRPGARSRWEQVCRADRNYPFFYDTLAQGSETNCEPLF